MFSSVYDRFFKFIFFACSLFTFSAEMIIYLANLANYVMTSWKVMRVLKETVLNSFIHFIVSSSLFPLGNSLRRLKKTKTNLASYLHRRHPGIF